MSSRCHTPPLFTQCTESGRDALQCWPQIDKRLEGCPQIETPPSKKLKISETVASARMPESNNKVLTDTFFKTQLYMNFRLGNCINGDNSPIPRGSGNIRRPKFHEQGLDSKEGYVAGIWEMDHRLSNKMKLCRFFSGGCYCPYGERCCFLHEGLEKSRVCQGKWGESSFVSNVCIGSARSYRNGFGQMEFKRFGNSSLNTYQVHSNQGFWRTKLCYKWELYGNCPYEGKCVFAHGQAGILPVLTHFYKS